MAVDVASLSLLAWNLGFAWYTAVALGAGVGGITTYGAQWRYLLSNPAYERSDRPLRYVVVAAAVLAANIGGFWLVARRLFYSYLGVRLVTAIMVLVAWGRDRRGWRRKL